MMNYEEVLTPALALLYLHDLTCGPPLCPYLFQYSHPFLIFLPSRMDWAHYVTREQCFANGQHPYYYQIVKAAKTLML